YCEEHIQPQSSLQMPEDHVSFEFEFMANLIERQNEALKERDWETVKKYEDTISKFHKEHQLNWIDDLCATIQDTANTRFYRGVGKVTKGFVHLETDVLTDIDDVIDELIEYSEES
ncbi:MAG: molecular chaperone TorD family protein, partial [Eggerthellaceae bacterium]|nr:molecular chaperone TorD family protein [Eggerthellaceae bacterium]